MSRGFRLLFVEAHIGMFLAERRADLRTLRVRQLREGWNRRLVRDRVGRRIGPLRQRT